MTLGNNLSSVASIPLSIRGNEEGSSAYYAQLLNKDKYAFEDWCVPVSDYVRRIRLSRFLYVFLLL